MKLEINYVFCTCGTATAVAIATAIALQVFANSKTPHALTFDIMLYFQ